MNAFLLEHITRNDPHTTDRRFPRLSRGFLQAGFYSVDGCVAEGAHGTADETDDGGLIAREFGGVVGGLQVLKQLFEFGVGAEVHGLVCSLAEGGEGDAAVYGADAFFFQDGEHGVGGVAVFGYVEGVGHGMVLGLEPDFDDFHGSDDGDGFGHTGCESG